jgi:CRP/FNR family cyclic AMP-dependent transcriptional regulator
MAVSTEESGSGEAMKASELGKVFGDGEIIVREGEAGDVMFEILSGRVEVLQKREGQEVRLAILGKGDFFGEMAIFEREVRSATVRALGEVRVLTIDKKILLRRISEDPSLALRILEKMSHRIRELDNELVGLRTIVP